MICAGCKRELEIGDHYIEGTPSEILGEDVDPELGGLVTEIMGSGHGDKIVYCEGCTVEGGDFLFSTYYGDQVEPCSTCGGRGWHTAGGNDPSPCGRCPAGEAYAR